MPRERAAEYKPLSFSTTMRNPERIAGFLNCILPYEQHNLSNEIIMDVAKALIKSKLYIPVYVSRTPKSKANTKQSIRMKKSSVTSNNSVSVVKKDSTKKIINGEGPLKTALRKLKSEGGVSKDTVTAETGEMKSGKTKTGLQTSKQKKEQKAVEKNKQITKKKM